MSKLIILSTPSAVLNIKMKTASCSMKISKKRHFLMIHQKEEKPFNEIQLELKDNLKDMDVDMCNFPSKVNEFSLNITVHIGYETVQPTISVVYSGAILVESTVVPVSKELLAISSEYFTSLFYGNYLDDETGIKRIKQVSEDNFEIFMNMMHQRKFDLSSVEEAIISLGFADYFGMIGVIEKTVPFLLNNDLPEDLLIQGLALADRIPNNSELLEWVLKNIPTDKELFRVLHDSLPIISPQTAQYCLLKLQESCLQSDGVKVFHRYFTGAESLKASLTSDQVGIILCRYDGTNFLDSNGKCFAIPITRPTPATIRIAIDDIWPHVPNGVNQIVYSLSPIFNREERGRTNDINICELALFWFQ